MKFNKKSIVTACVLAVVVVGGVLMVKSGDTTTSMSKDTVIKKDIKTYYTYSGEVKAKNTQAVTLNNDFKVKEILVKEGDKVEKGDILFKLSSGSNVTSKIDGEVSEIFVNTDVDYEGGMQLATVTNRDALQIEININEHDIKDIDMDDKVDVYINALDETVEGKIINLSKNANVINNISYFRAVIEIEEKEKTEDILTGMSTEIKIVKDDVKDVKAISMDAIAFDSENQPYVYVKNAEGNLVEKTLTLGVNDGVNVEVKNGLKDGDEIYYNSKSAFDPFEMMNAGGK